MDEGGTQTNGPEEMKVDDAQGLTSERWHMQTVCVKKKQMMRICLHWRLCGYIKAQGLKDYIEKSKERLIKQPVTTLTM